MRSFLRLLGRRILLLVVLLAVIFVAVDLLPGNAARAALGRSADPEQVAAKEHELGLDRPVLTRFADWMTGVVTGDFGHNARGRPVGELLADTFGPTMLLGGLAVALTVLAALLLGGWWALRPRSAAARLLQPATTVAAAVPEFVVATGVITLFALVLGWLPAVTITGGSGYPADPSMLVLPVLALAIPQIGWNTRVVWSALNDASAAPHVEAAVLDGLAPARVLTRHVLPGAAPTIVAGFATSVGMVLGGALVVETIFNYPGLGALLAGSVGDRDTAVVAAVVAGTGVVIMLLLAVADAVRSWAVQGR